MERITKAIDYIKLFIVMMLYCLGSEPSRTAFFICTTLLLTAIGAELFLIRARRLYVENYIDGLSKAAERVTGKGDAA